MNVFLVSLKDRLTSHLPANEGQCRVEHRHGKRHEGHANGHQCRTLCRSFHGETRQEKTREHAARITQEGASRREVEREKAEERPCKRGGH